MSHINASVSALFCANAFSILGNVFSEMAIPWFVYQLTGSATATAGVLIAGALPNLVVGLFAGSLIDRFGARAVSLATDAVNFFAIALIPLLFQLDVLNTLLLATLVFLSKVFDTPGNTARQVMLAEQIAHHGLPRERINGGFSLIDTIADLLGPILAGLLLTVIGALYLLNVDALTFLLSFLIILIGCRSARPAPDTTKPVSIWQAWRWLFATPTVRVLAFYDALVNSVATALLAVCMPVLASDYAGNATVYGFWMASFALGTTLTSLLYTWLGHRLSAQTLLRLTPLGQNLGIAGLFATLLFDWPSAMACVALFCFGANLGVGSMLDARLLQIQVPEDRRGSVFSAFSALRYMGVPLTILLAGYLLDQGQLVGLVGLFLLLNAVAAALWLKTSLASAV